MAVGRIPGLAVDRTGVALLGLIVLLASGELTLDAAGRAIDVPTLALLFSLMILSAQFERSGFYAWIAERVTGAVHSPRMLLAALIGATGVLSAVLTNDVVAFALTPLVCAGFTAQRIDPRAYLVALGGSANAGSAATLIGNPQNILIGQAGGLEFWAYVGAAAVPTIAALAAVYIAVLLTWPASFPAAPPSTSGEGPASSLDLLDRNQLAKAFAALIALIALFLSPLPRELGALAVAGALLLSRRMSSREVIGAVDWHLLLLFICLFGVTAAFAETGLAEQGVHWLAARGLLPDRLAVMAPLTLAASNTIGNVPAVILILSLLPDLSDGTLTGLALLSTFAGNLLLTGSLCNIIVAERASLSGVHLGFLDFARSGIPMTLASLAAAVFWLWAIGLVPV
jgi:Na+/H+ antiporter NhaD/arsenite permease-like protein